MKITGGSFANGHALFIAPVFPVTVNLSHVGTT